MLYTRLFYRHLKMRKYFYNQALSICMIKSETGYFLAANLYMSKKLILMFILTFGNSTSVMARIATEDQVMLKTFEQINSLKGVNKSLNGEHCANSAVAKAAQAMISPRGPAAIAAVEAACPNYVDSQGFYGEKGQHIKKLLEGENSHIYHNALMGSEAGDKPGMKEVCPAWKRMSLEQRKQFWVWTFAAISSDESTCGQDPKSKRAFHDHVTGMLPIGEFQMNYERKHRQWRGRKLGLRNCAVPNVTSFESNMACSLDIMVDQFAGVYSNVYVRRGKRRVLVHHPTGLTGNSYWAELKTNRTPSRMQTSPILKNIKKFPPCGAKN
jgi:hypothetical protein